MMADEATEIAPAVRGIVDPTRIEPQVLTPVELTPAPADRACVQVALLELPAGAAYRPPAEPCRDVLILVRAGELRAVGRGVAPPEAPSTLYAGDAVRFGPEGDGLLQNLGEVRARTVVAFVRGEDGRCGPPPHPDDPFVAPIRTASVRTTAPLDALDGALRVRILLDADGHGARYGGLSVLDGDPALVVPEHRHPEAAEVLFIEEGHGVLRIGDRAMRVRPGVAVYVPEGELHSFRGDDGAPLRAIQVYTPSGPEQRYR